MEFGVPKEMRETEARVGLTPAGVLALVETGSTVYVEKGAGLGSGYTDEDYRQNGAQIVYAAAEVYGRSDIVVKVARPTVAEHRLFRPGQTIFAFFHLPVSSPDLMDALKEREITAVANEMIEDADGYKPVLVPLSEVTGRMAPIIAGQLLMNTSGGRGTLLSGIPSVPRGAVAIVGAGVLGANAARAFLGLGAQVVLLDNNIRKLQELDDQLNGRITTMLASRHSLRRVTAFADVLVGAIQVPGQRAEQCITQNMVGRMKPGSVILDFSINDGGCVATSRPTTLNDPTYVVHGVIHYCVPNVSAAVARTTSAGLNNALIPYLKAITKYGVVGMLDHVPGFANGVALYQGNLAQPRIAAALGREVETRITLGGAQ